MPKYVAAIRQHDDSALREIIAVGEWPLNVGDEYWNPPIIEAVQHGVLSTLKLLVEAGVDTNTKSTSRFEYYGTALRFAVNRRDVGMIKFLIQSGADPEGLTPLMIAILERNEGQVAKILEHISTEEIEKSDYLGSTPFSYCSPNRRMLELLTKGRSFKWLKQLDLAASLNDTNTLASLITRNPSKPGTNELKNALNDAIEYDSIQSVRMLVDAGVDLNGYDGNFMTPLCLAAKHGRPAIIQLLLTRGADPDKACDSIFKALHFAELSGCTNCLMLLRKNGE